MAGVRGADGRNAEKLGYLGLGMVGFPMTRRLVNAGYDVTVWNRSSGKTAALVEAGAKPAVHPHEVAAAAGIIFMCLTDAAAVEEVVSYRCNCSCRAWCRAFIRRRSAISQPC
jgi:3-hydroxyisobutyrate dehydrogenase